MNYYKCHIQYKGSNYAGLQYQKGLATIQNDINIALEKITRNKISTVAASRTDTGVHAFLQIIKITSSTPIELEHFVENFNKIISPDIRCLSIQVCSGEFRPTVGAISKEYRYFFTNNKQVSKDEREFIANISNELNIELIKDCLTKIIGTHDFCNFCSTGSNVTSTIRTIFECELELINPHEIFNQHTLFKIPDHLTECYQLKIKANGFLKQMIRHLISALWMVGSGKISIEDFNYLLSASKITKQQWKVAPANGLFLYKINY